VGASRGIGAAVARGFAGAGAAVVVAARDGDALDRLVDELSAAGAHTLAVSTDVTDPGAVANLAEQTLSAFGSLDIACNNAAGGGSRLTHSPRCRSRHSTPHSP
jgi:NAD(P)-dependent dehydrogenase (short-subunit alcohol dehydrogenase family)